MSAAKMKPLRIEFTQWVARMAIEFHCAPGELYPIWRHKDQHQMHWYVRDRGFFYGPRTPATRWVVR